MKGAEMATPKEKFRKFLMLDLTNANHEMASELDKLRAENKALKAIINWQEVSESWKKMFKSSAEAEHGEQRRASA